MVVPLCFCTALCRAQQTNGLADPASSPSVSEAGSVQSTESNPSTSFGSSISTRANSAGRGSQQGASSYLLPRFEWAGTYNSNGVAAPGQSKARAETLLLGSLTLQRTWSRSQFSLDDAGGDSYPARPLGRSTSGSVPWTSGLFDRLDATETFSARRWQLLLSDELFYLPESESGFVGFSGLGGIGPSLAAGAVSGPQGLDSIFLPNQSILTGNVRRVSNIAVAQAQNSVGSRSTISLTGSYGGLYFLGPGFIDSSFVSGIAAYNRAMTARDELGFEYVYQFFNLGSRGAFSGGQFSNQGIVLTYRREVSRRFSLNVLAGPFLNQTNLAGTSSRTKLAWTAHATLEYRSERTDAELQYQSHVSGGAGVLPGAQNNTASLTVGRRVSPRTHVSADLDYTFNTSLIRVSQGASRYGTWLGGLTLNRGLSDSWDLFFGSNYQRQQVNRSTCFGSACGTLLVRYVGQVGLTWRGRARPLH